MIRKFRLGMAFKNVANDDTRVEVKLAFLTVLAHCSKQSQVFAQYTPQDCIICVGTSRVLIDGIILNSLSKPFRAAVEL
jgi:hypothetical protein